MGEEWIAWVEPNKREKYRNKISVVYNVSLEKNVFNPIIVDRSNLADPTVPTLIWPQAMPAIKFGPISSHQAGE